MADDGSLEPVAWLAGTWLTDDGETEEVWTTPRGGTMLGVNRTVVAGVLRHFEHLRIASEEGAIFYHASPVRQAPARFRLVEQGERLVFEDPEHDYPQRIVYRRLAVDRLEAGIEGSDEGRPKSSRWPMRRSGAP
jgi:hypothetical protein